MSKVEVTMVRVYFAEGRDHHIISKVLKWLEKSEVGGFTVFRGVAGFGSDHKLHKATLVDLTVDLPIILEFFDSPQRVEEIIEELGTMVSPNHIVSWSAQTGI
jgi:hypothetical protein